MTLVFVYGTLTDPATAAHVLPDYEFQEAATLSGLHRVDGEYPTLAPGGEVTGRLLVTEDLDALDRYEGVDSELYARISVPLVDDGSERQRESERFVETYVGVPDRLGVEVEWPGKADFPACVRTFVSENGVLVDGSRPGEQ